MMFFIGIYPQIHIFSEFGSKIRAKNYKIEIQLPTKRK